jgi:hypothetical protein
MVGVCVKKKIKEDKTSKMNLNLNAVLFKQNVESEIQKSSGTNSGARYECIYKNFLREIRQYYSIKFEQFI